MKKRILIIAVTAALLALLLVPALGGCVKRENKLLVYTCEDYLAPGVADKFEDYYFETTGEKVNVEVSTYGVNEEMYQKIVSKQSDYDIVCPSDYTIEKMIKEGYLNKLDKDLGNDVNGNAIEDYRGNVAPMLKGDGGYFDYDKNNEYSGGFMWGTMGIVYNKANVSMAELEEQGWGILWNSKYKGRIDMKDSVRDTYAIGAIYTYKNEIANGTMSLSDVLNATDSDSIEKVKQSLIAQKPLLHEYETDTGKQTIIDGKTDLLLQWSGDANYTIATAKETDGAPELGYYVPEEGSNLWCDCFCIPKYAVNTKAANLWINFLCRSDIAIANMEDIYYTSAIATSETLEWAKNASDGVDDNVGTLADLSYFFDPSKFGAEVKNMSAYDVQYPDFSVIKRCAVMRDYGDNQSQINNMWTALKNA